MNVSTIRTSIVSALVGASLVAGVQGFAQHEGHDMSKMPAMKASSTGSSMLMKISKESMQKSMNHPMPMTGDVDRDFSAMMADHHAMGIRMADVELKYGKSAAVKALANKIKTAQTKERTQLMMHAKMNHK